MYRNTVETLSSTRPVRVKDLKEPKDDWAKDAIHHLWNDHLWNESVLRVKEAIVSLEN